MNEILFPLLIATLVLSIFYRRVRRLFGEQDVSQRKLLFRAVVTFSLTALLLLLPSSSLLARATGVALGLGLALVAVATTTLHAAGQRYRYTPNSLVGVVILVVLVVRWAQRAFAVSRVSEALRGDLAEIPATLGRDPFSRVLLLGLLTYLTAYNMGIFVKSARLRARG